jgi:hypothetical protein
MTARPSSRYGLITCGWIQFAADALGWGAREAR